MLARGSLPFMLVAMTACGGNAPAPIAPQATTTFTASGADVPNPERGLFQVVDVFDDGDITYVANLGVTLGNARIVLDAYRDRPIDDAYLARLATGFDRVRAAGLKLVLRFQYNTGTGPDAPLDRVLAHIAQLTPVLRTHADVIATVQAGFIGAWGEWHGSTNGLDTPSARAMIAIALLDALPPTRAIQIRTPGHKQGITPGGPLDERTGFSSDLRARIGHHNDCFLGSDDDVGTYGRPVEAGKQLVAADGLYTPVGGETCKRNAPRSDCATALAEMAQLHWSFANRAWHEDVLAAWESQGCLDEIRRRLGYRFVLREARWSEAAVPGGALDLDLDIENVGFAAPYNARPVYAVIGEGAARVAIRLHDVDARRWRPGETTHVAARLTLPASTPIGTQRLALWLPDPAGTLRDRPAYAIQLLSEGVWSASDGVNVITRALRIDPAR